MLCSSSIVGYHKDKNEGNKKGYEKEGKKIVAVAINLSLLLLQIFVLLNTLWAFFLYLAPAP